MKVRFQDVSSLFGENYHVASSSGKGAVVLCEALLTSCYIKSFGIFVPRFEKNMGDWRTLWAVGDGLSSKGRRIIYAYSCYDDVIETLGENWAWSDKSEHLRFLFSEKLDYAVRDDLENPN